MTLVADDAGCVRGVNAGTGERISLLWPDGYKVGGDASSFEVEDFRGNSIAVSGVVLRVAGGGAALSAAGIKMSGCEPDKTGWVVGAIARA